MIAKDLFKSKRLDEEFDVDDDNVVLELDVDDGLSGFFSGGGGVFSFGFGFSGDFSTIVGFDDSIDFRLIKLAR